jgi:tyrosinase
MAITAPVTAAPRPATLKHRKSVRRLNATQLAALRQAISATMPIRDERGYQYHAGHHGLPLPFECVHHQQTPLFLPWHRAYLYFFELALIDQVPEARLAWWDWRTVPGHAARGLPEAYAEEEIDGQANPLYSAPVSSFNRDPDWPETTSRDPGPPEGLPSAPRVEEILTLDSFSDFTTQLEEVHDQVHGWVGGTMGAIDFAAYDPIFWAHHTMVDRLWYLWQLRHGRPGPPENLWRRALPPFNMTVEQTLSVRSLGYDYAATTAHVPGT